jgi:hypothetical protein
MEYPTLITAGTYWWAPQSILSPERVIVHEFGHQFWYGLAANNEFEEAWLDEGLDTYSTAKVMEKVYGENFYLQRFFGSIPFVSEEIRFGHHDQDRSEVRQNGAIDVMARRAWEYHGTYVVNSYYKPGLVLYTLEKILGETVMTRILRVYQQRWRFRHPTTRDFIAVVNDVSGRDMTEFFNQTFFSSGLIDYAIESITNRDESIKAGIVDPPASGSSNGTARGPAKEPAGPPGKSYHADVVVRRLGEARLPVDVLVRFADGSVKREAWDGQYTWKKFSYDSPAKIIEAVVDPEGKLPLDVNLSNNSRKAETETSWAARKWAARWLFWFQHFLEVSASPL